MSAWTVSHGHIDVLVNAALQYGMVSDDLDTLIALGDELWAENYASVNYRYDETDKSPDYNPVVTSLPLAPLAVLKAISCYEYQTCEHPEWKTSTAKAVVDSIQRAAESRLSAKQTKTIRSRFGETVPAYKESDEYDAQPWGFDSLEQAVAPKKTRKKAS